MSVEGNRYGVPWTYAGRTVEARVLARTVEIWSASTRLAVPPRQGGTGQTLLLPGQWDGLATGALRRLSPVGLQVSRPVVESRSLAIYDALAGVSPG